MMIVWGYFTVMKSPPKPMSSKITNASAPYRLLNIGNNNPVTLDRFISAIENSLSKKARKICYHARWRCANYICRYQ